MESTPMKNPFFALLPLVWTLSAAADDTAIIQRVSNPSEGNSSVLVETTKNARIRPDFQILEGEEEIAGDPTAGTREALKSWKDACAEWKKELKENNKERGAVLLSNCGRAKFAKDETMGAGSGVYIYTSQGKYKIRVRIQDK